MKSCIINAKLVLENGIEWNGRIVVEDGRIAACGAANEIDIPVDAEVIDAGGLYVGPGFVDIHVHGGAGTFLYKDPLEGVKHFLSHGETTVLPTIYYDIGKDEMLEAIARVRAAMKADDAGHAIGGIYMEGPYMNPSYGALSEKNKWKGDIREEDFIPLVEAAGDAVKVWAVAPERPGLENFVRCAAAANPGVMFSVGHSEATPAQVRAFKRYGLGLMTHCMNATGLIGQRSSGVRGIGPNEACFTDPDMFAELICDSLAVHVKPDNQRLLLAIKGVDRVVLITDSFVSDCPAPENMAHVEDIVWTPTGGINGSKLTMDLACRNIMHHTRCGITEAFLMASRNPARVIGMEDEVGTIEAGKRANLVFVNDCFEVKKVILDGREWHI